MASRKALSFWVDMVSQKDIEAVAPQHGAVIKGKDNVKHFFDWLADLECGVDVMAEATKKFGSMAQTISAIVKAQKNLGDLDL